MTAYGTTDSGSDPKAALREATEHTPHTWRTQILIDTAIVTLSTHTAAHAVAQYRALHGHGGPEHRTLHDHMHSERDACRRAETVLRRLIADLDPHDEHDSMGPEGCAWCDAE